jgi:hypothetical protein
MTASDALLHHDELAALRNDGDRLHGPLAGGRTITWILIDMARPQAAWAMVGEAIADDIRPAVHAIEALGGPCEPGSHVTQ